MSDVPVARRRKRPHRLVRFARRLARDVRGIAAVEFGFIAPVMMVMLIGAVEITRAISVDRRFSVVTSMIADLVAREEKLTADDVNAIYDIVEQVMKPYEAGPLKISIIPVLAHPTNAGNTVVYPAVSNRPSYNGGAQPARCQTYAMTPGLLEPKESVVVIEASYSFTPMFVGYLMNPIQWTDKAIAKPRKASCVDFGDKCGSCF